MTSPRKSSTSSRPSPTPRRRAGLASTGRHIPQVVLAEIALRLTLPFLRPRRLFDMVRNEHSLTPAIWFLLALTTLYLAGYNILFWYESTMPTSARAWPGLAAAARDWVRTWLPAWPWLALASLMSLALAFAVAAVVAMVANLFRAPVSFRHAVQGLSYSCPPAYTVALLATACEILAPATRLDVVLWIAASVWYVVLLTIALSTLARTTWPRLVVPAVIGGSWW